MWHFKLKATVAAFLQAGGEGDAAPDRAAALAALRTPAPASARGTLSMGGPGSAAPRGASLSREELLARGRSRYEAHLRRATAATPGTPLVRKTE